MHYFLNMETKGFYRTFYVPVDVARFLYREFAKDQLHSHDMPAGAEEAWSSGIKISSISSDHRNMVLWGNGQITEKEIFKQILKGKLYKLGMT